MKNDRNTKLEPGTILKSSPQKLDKREVQLKERGHRAGIEAKQYQTLNSVHDSEIRYRRLFEAAQDGILILDADTAHITDINPFLQEMTGYSSSEVIGKTLLEIGLFKDITAGHANFTDIQSKASVRYEDIPLETKDGKQKRVEFVRTSYLVEGKKVIQCSIRDITERKKAEKELVNAEDIHRTIFDNTSDGIFLVDLKTRTFFMYNAACLKMLGYTKEEFSNLAIPDIHPREDLPFIFEQIGKFSRGEEAIRSDIRFTRKDGTIFITDLSPVLLTIGGKECLLISFKDITERKLAESALQESEEKFRTFFSTSRDCAFITSADGSWIDLNDAAVELFGYASREELMQVKPSSFDVNAKDRDKYNSMIAERGFTKDYPADLRKKNGAVIHTLITSAVRRNAEGHVIGFMGTVRDITERKRAEAALKESEERYHALFTRSLDLVYICDFEGNFIDANDAALNLLGYTKEDIGSLNFASLLSEDQLPLAFKTTREIRETGVQKYVAEFRLRCRDGKELTVESTGSPIISNGIAVAIQSIARDITERKRSEEILKKSEEKYRGIFENVQDVYYESLIDGTIIEISPSIKNVSKGQYERDDLIGKSMYDFYSTLGERKAVVSKIRKHGSVTDLEVTLVNRDGSLIPCSISAKLFFDGQGHPEKIVGSMRDITKRKWAEEALQESEIRFRSLYENATIGLYRTTPDGKILLANPALVKMLGHASFESLTERNLEKEGFETSSQRREFLEKIERDGEVHGYASKWIRLDGTAIFVLESARTIRDSHGKTLYYDGTVEDVTQLRQTEEAMWQMQKMEELGTLAGGIAHDFNNILGIILAYVTSIKWFKEDTRRLDAVADSIIKAVDRGKALVQQILTFASRTGMDLGPVNVNDVVMEIMTMILETFPRVLTYAQNIDKNIPRIHADRSQLHQALLNLCVNARDAMQAGGILTINTRVVSGMSLRDRHPDALPESYVCIEVCDTGEGMTEDIRKRIFDPFFTTKVRGKGTGLGLAVVFGVVRTHKGYVEVESEPGKGTTFRLFLPATRAAEPVGAEIEGKKDNIRGGTETILVVEDEEDLMDPLLAMLLEKGYRVLPACNGLEAVDIYEEGQNMISLVLTDMELPKLSGLDVCRRIKEFNPRARIIVATGFLNPETKSELLKLGLHQFIYKPYDPNNVLKIVREVLDEK